jgi:hypothetical protein
MAEKDVCLNCQFFNKATGNSVHDGWCKIKLPPQHIRLGADTSIRFADEQTCDLHRHLNRRR